MLSQMCQGADFTNLFNKLRINKLGGVENIQLLLMPILEIRGLKSIANTQYEN